MATGESDDIKISQGQFKKFATKKADGSALTSKDMTRWFKDAGVFGKTCTSNSCDIAFTKCSNKAKKTLDLSQLEKMVDEIAKDFGKDKKIDDKAKAATKIRGLLEATDPKTHGGTKTSQTGNVSGMTDSSKYTGAHKERFDESGKGKGLEGRKDKVDDSGYVGAYKEKGSFDKKH